jgi:hypothetical protein
MLHVFLARLCGVLPGRHPGPGTPGVAEAGSGASRVGHTSSACNPALGPWERAKGVAADVGNDANHDHVPVHVADYPGRTRKETR